ncbi:beta-N-acetylhexosaminidase [Nakamurella sp. UYEF19]|uniref:glycoside hydrolase family 3 N-terminal domain-containing protein n=1 Tax=Nakamurella sp. UYEF19 TaxID=1756392 RepID=UPI003396886D
MTDSRHLINRRTALIAGTAAVMGGLGFAGTAQAGEPGDGGQSRHPKLSPAQQAGQRVIFSYPGLTPPATLLQQISAGLVGGVIFFGENITSLPQITAVVDQLRSARAQSPLKSSLLLMTDQEGGVVRRLKGQAPVLSEKAIGASADPVGEATAAGTGAGQILSQVGMNLNLAPVLDVYRQEGNFDDEFGRSYSSDPAVAASLGAAFVRSQQKVGVAATAKHFPGLGLATKEQNTDLVPVTLDATLSQLRSVDEPPFASAIAAGVDLVMASWAIYPALDHRLPAGLSRAVIEGELRRRLRFRGVTITDALEAGSLTAFGSPAELAVKAAEAGMDLLLCSARDVDQGTSTVAALATALRTRRCHPGQFEQALARVLDLQRRLA